ncbi:MAG TPA: tripartite tricarboxylate transporter substrate binding protein [Burkholderiales bacterium]|nr:tripartite tricarboxylate transporter substrate binding protein [Burkholderiales bacterium]
MRVYSFLLIAAAGFAASSAYAQPYPTKPIRFIVPFVPGGGTDITARAIGQKLSEAFGKPVVVDNRPGAGGVIGADIVAKAVPDGYTLLLGSPGPLTINPNLQSKMPYDTLRDFAPVSLATISPFILVIHPSVPASNVRELIAYAKDKPNALNYGSAGNGSVAHLSAEQFKALTGIQLTHVPYKGSSQAAVDILSGRLQLIFENLPVVLPHIRSGKLKALATGTRNRSALVPELPTMIEAGVPGYESSTAFGVLAPAKTPRAIVSRVSAEIAKALQGGDVKEGLAARGFEPVGSTPEEYTAQLREELKRVARVVKLANIRLD